MRDYIVTLKFERGPNLVSIEKAAGIGQAISMAERYARACGFTHPITKRFVREKVPCEQS